MTVAALVMQAIALLRSGCVCGHRGADHWLGKCELCSCCQFDPSSPSPDYEPLDERDELGEAGA